MAAAREQFGPSARGVGVRRVRSGGVLGFFATERYVAEMAPDLDGRPGGPRPPPPPRAPRLRRQPPPRRHPPCRLLLPPRLGLPGPGTDRTGPQRRGSLGR